MTVMDRVEVAPADQHQHVRGTHAERAVAEEPPILLELVSPGKPGGTVPQNFAPHRFPENSATLRSQTLEDLGPFKVLFGQRGHGNWHGVAELPEGEAVMRMLCKAYKVCGDVLTDGTGSSKSKVEELFDTLCSKDFAPPRAFSLIPPSIHQWKTLSLVLGNAILERQISFAASDEIQRSCANAFDQIGRELFDAMPGTDLSRKKDKAIDFLDKLRKSAADGLMFHKGEDLVLERIRTFAVGTPIDRSEGNTINLSGALLFSLMRLGNNFPADSRVFEIVESRMKTAWIRACSVLKND